jgi:hypothetical protein
MVKPKPLAARKTSVSQEEALAALGITMEEFTAMKHGKS